jgi:Fe-S cluster assembly protein SufD
MTGQTMQSYTAALLPEARALPAGPSAWLNRLRGAALERANALVVPTLRDEDWRFTDLSPLYKTAYQPAAAPGELPRTAIGQFFVPEAGARLVYVDGHYVPELSLVGVDGLSVGTVADVLRGATGLVETHLARLVGFETDPFAAVNTAYLQHGAAIVAPCDSRAGRPVHLLFVSTQPDRASYPRVLVVAERGAEITFVEDYVSLVEDASYFVNGVTEIAAGENASVRHVRVQRESDRAFHIATCGISLARDARYVAQSISVGGRISRLNHNVRQDGEGTDCEIDGLALIAGRQLADTHSAIDHARPNGRSRQLHKCIVDEAAHAVFNGRIVVQRGAQRTDSAQSSRNLLLTGKARVDTKPQLEILADDVKCAHGATVGQLDPEHIFYLRSRGLDEAAAQNLLTYAFAAEIVDRIPVGSLRARLEDLVTRRTHSHALEGPIR